MSKKYSPAVVFGVILWGTVWLGISVDVLFSLQESGIIINLAGQIELIIHFFIVVAMVRMYTNVRQNDEKIFVWALIYNLGLLISDLSWYVITYFHGLDLVTVGTRLLLTDLAPFLFWISGIIVFLSKVLRKYVFVAGHKLKLILVMLTITIVIVILFLSSIHYAVTIFSVAIVMQISNFIGQIVVFDFVILCLLYARNRGFAIFLVGVITITAGYSFFIYSTISQTLNLTAYGELFWLLGLLLNWLGLVLIHHDGDYQIKNWVRKNNAIKSKLAFWYFSMSIISFLLFFLIAYKFSFIDKNLFSGLPLFITLYSTVMIAISLKLGNSVESPFKQIVENIQSLTDGKAMPNPAFSTEEFTFLQEYIVESFEHKEEVLAKVLELEILELQNKEFQAIFQEQEKFRKVVKQVMHDITSPISSIDNIVSKLSSNVPEADRVTLRNALARISGISQKLLSQYGNKDAQDELEDLLVSLALLQIINEKREEHRESGVVFNIDMDDEVGFSFIKHNAGIFKRMISNLVNNSVDALKAKLDGKISISLGKFSGNLAIIVEDNGPGMAKHIQEKFDQGIEVTEGKEKGHGLGLTQVRDAIIMGGGKYNVYATDKGTQISIWFPEIPTPKWIASEIKVTQNDVVVILDDDESIHGSWDKSFEVVLDQNPTLVIKHFTLASDAIEYINNLTTAQEEKVFLLTDYELLDQGINGLDVIAQSGISRSILVTSYSANFDLQSKVMSTGIKMLPKELAHAVSIGVDKKIPKWSKRVDMVWVEDQAWLVDDLVNRYYSGLTVDVYYDPVSFMSNVDQYPLDTKIILDTYYESSDGVPYLDTGYDIANRLYAMGYTKLILYTGEKPTKIIPDYLTVVLKEDPYATENMDKL